MAVRVNLVSEVYPSRMYRDPSDIVDALREVDRELKAHTAESCGDCHKSSGRIFGHDVCGIGKKRDSDGYCSWMDKRGGGDATASRGA